MAALGFTVEDGVRRSSKWRTMLRGVRGESNRVSFLNRRAATGEELGEASVSGAKPQLSFLTAAARAGEVPAARRRRRRASLSGDGEERWS